MKAQVIERTGTIGADSRPLQWVDLPDPTPAADEVLIRVHACGVCHTELDEIEGRLPPTRLPMVPGHQVTGRIIGRGANVTEWQIGDRVGVAWIFSACGQCAFCQTERENLCAQFQATGRDRFGGYAELMTAPAAFVHRLPDALSDVDAAPLLCAGAIGYRSLRLTNLADGQTLGLTGFGASAHLVLKMARRRLPNTKVYVFARSEEERAFALDLGAEWAGETRESAPVALDAIVDTTPAWLPIVQALENLSPGGRLVVNAIRKESTDQAALLRLDYPRHLWMEKEIKSVANVTRRDVREFLQLAAELSLHAQTKEYPLADANRAIAELKTRSVVGAKVLRVEA